MDRLFAEVDVDSVDVPECHRLDSPPAGNSRDVERALELIEKADLVTDCHEVRHPFHEGLLARKGIEY